MRCQLCGETTRGGTLCPPHAAQFAALRDEANEAAAEAAAERMEAARAR